MNREDELARRREIERANQAGEIIKHPMWDEAWTALESKLTDAWKASQTGQSERREMIYLQLRAAAEVRGYFEEIALTGAMASQQLERSDGREWPGLGK